MNIHYETHNLKTKRQKSVKKKMKRVNDNVECH